MIHYHGGPVTPVSAAITLWRRRHAFASFAHPHQAALAADLCQSFALDNGAYTFWQDGAGLVDVDAFASWVREWERHPAFDWAVIPDVIDGTEAENDTMLVRYREAGGDLARDVPVWHLHESLERLDRLARGFRRVALGSSGEFSAPNTSRWWGRVADAMHTVCDAHGRPRCRLHGLRMLDAGVCAHLPLASADSTNVARNVGIDQKWMGAYAPMTKEQRALVLADRIEHAPSADHWSSAFLGEVTHDLFGSPCL